ncbi:hypothetical protein [Nocardia terrae]|nr:hypothetical protein [Nocardia terrae]
MQAALISFDGEGHRLMFGQGAIAGKVDVGVVDSKNDITHP